jgi:hypothetical protein
MKSLLLLSCLLSAGVHAAAASSSASSTTPVVDQAGMKAGLMRYLTGYGQLCVGKYDWPITVKAQDLENGQRDAVQLPAMAQAGLVTATPAEEGAMRYTLTDAGRAYYWPRTVPRRDGTPGVKEVHDFCAGRLQLDSVVQWTPPVLSGDHYETTARYTYTIAAAPWTANARLQQAFPMITRVIKGQHTAQLSQKLQFVDGRWDAVVAVE